MKWYLDCEFNGFRGELLSIALYSPDSVEQFYAQLDPKKIGSLIQPFVMQHVLPQMDKVKPFNPTTLQTQLCYFLNTKVAPNDIIYADWAEDFMHLLGCVFGTDGKKFVQRLNMELITTPDTHKSQRPHHALFDAIALSLNHKAMLQNGSI